MTYAQTVALLPSSGYSRSGSGLPVRIGRNSSLALDIAIANAVADATATIIIETSSYAVRDRDRHAVTWRQLGNDIELVGNTSTSVVLANADIFARARYLISGAPVSITCAVPRRPVSRGRVRRAIRTNVDAFNRAEQRQDQVGNCGNVGSDYGCGKLRNRKRGP